MNLKGGIQLPNDVIEQGYVKSKKNCFEFEQVFHSPKHNFTGTEQEFIDNGLAYNFVEIDKFTRRILK